MWDTPQEFPYSTYDLEWSFIGRIHDVCNYDIVVAEEEFELKRAGHIDDGPPREAVDDEGSVSGPEGTHAPGMGQAHRKSLADEAERRSEKDKAKRKR